MSDHELLELAAKANGFHVKGWVGDRLVFFNPVTQSAEETWNPLEDDGDALRLAVRLRISLLSAGNNTACDIPQTDEYVWEDSIDGSAARRAIVRAAAEVGKSK